MIVTYYHVVPAERGHPKALANGYWTGKFPGRGGRFPATHPAAANSNVFAGPGDQQCGSSPQLATFRARGYWCSCFPEGDGICLDPRQGQDAKRVAKDLAECFDWDVVIKRP